MTTVPPGTAGSAPSAPPGRTRRGSAFAWLLVAQTVSICGTRMSMVALPWFVLVTTGSPLRTGVVAFAEMLPYVVVSVAAAPLTDRFGPRRTSIVCDLGSAVAVGAIPLLHAADVLSFGWLLALVVVAGALRGPGDNAKHVLLPAVADAAGVPLERATALYDSVNRVAGLVGAPLAGVLIGVFGAADVLLIDAATFVAAAALIAAGVTRLTVVAEDDEAGASYRQRVATGMRFLRADRLLFAIGGMLLLTNLLDAAFSGVLLPVWARDNGHGALGVGLVQGAFGVGATVGAMTMVVVALRLPRRATFLVCFLVAGCPRFFAMALDAPLPAVLALGAVGGFAAGALNPILSAVEMERIPEGKRARVLAAMTAVAWGGIPLGGLVGGWLIAGFGLTTALFTCGAVYFAATLVPLGRTWRDMDRRPAVVETTAR
jgi:MFS family permease